MKLSENSLRIKREVSELDEEVINFCQVLKDSGINYVIVSGYVAILTGRSRGTEDIDLIIETGKEEELISVLKENGYWCINDEIENIGQMLEDDISPRIAKQSEVIPNFELFYPKDKYDKKSMEESLEAELKNGSVKISPIELQIAYKLYLGSEKDLEDAEHLYQVFKEDLDEGKIRELANEMQVEEKLDELT